MSKVLLEIKSHNPINDTEYLNDGFYLIQDPYFLDQCVVLIKTITNKFYPEMIRIILYFRSNTSNVGFNDFNTVNINVISKINTITFS